METTMFLFRTLQKTGYGMLTPLNIFHTNNIIIIIFEHNGNSASVMEMHPTGEFPDRMVQKAAVWVLGPLCLVEVHNYVSSTAPL